MVWRGCCLKFAHGDCRCRVCARKKGALMSSTNNRLHPDAALAPLLGKNLSNVHYRNLFLHVKSQMMACRRTGMRRAGRGP